MVYITGDTHGDFKRFAQFKKLLRRRRDYCIVCGDFGFVWDGSPKELKRLAQFKKLRCTVLFVEGIHDNLDELEKFPETDFCGGRAVKLLDNLYWLKRGEVFELDGTTVFAMGGGESSDADERILGESWWVREMPSLEELAHARAKLANCGDKVDLIVTHHHPNIEMGLIDIRRETTNPFVAFLSQLSREVDYQHWYFGGNHMDKTISGKLTAVFEKVIKAQ